MHVGESVKEDTEHSVEGKLSSLGEQIISYSELRELSELQGNMSKVKETIKDKRG